MDAEGVVVMPVGVLAAVVAVPVLFVASLAAPTGMGQFRRSPHVRWVVLAALFFPIAWEIWDRRDTPTRGVLLHQRPMPPA
ncbi:hypothetical protein ACVH9Z_28835 [Rhodococcus opacus]|uniref:hypothetical protein n=1 Tax=Rhodococcus opacus TaxID=37919 RepID=UPI0012FD75B2|nr:hypothetical protein [Rhodococcus opacus]